MQTIRHAKNIIFIPIFRFYDTYMTIIIIMPIIFIIIQTCTIYRMTHIIIYDTPFPAFYILFQTGWLTYPITPPLPPPLIKALAQYNMVTARAAGKQHAHIQVTKVSHQMDRGSRRGDRSVVGGEE